MSCSLSRFFFNVQESSISKLVGRLLGSFLKGFPRSNLMMNSWSCGRKMWSHPCTFMLDMKMDSHPSSRWQKVSRIVITTYVFSRTLIISRSCIIFTNDGSLHTFAAFIRASETPMLTMSRIPRDCLSSTESGNLRASSSRLPWGWHSPKQQPPSPCLITGELLPPRYYVFLPWSSHRPWTEVEGIARDERVRQGQWQWQGNSGLWWAWSELWQRLFLQYSAKEQCGYQGGWQPRGSLTSADVQDRRWRRWGL